MANNNMPIPAVAVHYTKLGGLAQAAAKAHATSRDSFSATLENVEAATTSPTRQNQQAVEEVLRIQQSLAETKRPGNLSILV
jgi:hypothetical protein